MISGILIAGCNVKESFPKQTFNLTFASTNPPESMDYKVRLGWISYLKKASGGRLNITISSGGQPDQYLNMVRSKMLDMADFSEVRTPGLFPLHEVIQLPFMFDTPECRIAAISQYLLGQKYPELENEISGVKSWALGRRGSFQVFTKNKPVHVLEDMKGLRLIIRGTIQSQTTELLGAIPTDVGDSMWHNSIEQGLVDGINNNYPSQAYLVKAYEVCNYVTEISACGGGVEQIMNLEVWNSLPEDLQKLLDDTQLKYINAYGYALDRWSQDAKALIDQSLKDRGYEGVYILSKNEKERWIAAVEPVFENWIINVTPIVGEGKARAILADIKQFSTENTLTDAVTQECESTLREWGVEGY